METIAISDDFFNFAVIPDWDGFIQYLADLAEPEHWSDNNEVLKNYITHTFKKLFSEYTSCETETEKEKIIYIDEKYICFNTGLFTKNYEEIYGLFKPNKIPPLNKAWVFKGFYTSAKLMGLPVLPRRAKFFKTIEDIILDTSKPIDCNISHILDDPNNRARIPESVRDLPNINMIFEGALSIAIKRVKTNFKVAVPQYYRGKIQFLLPISLIEPSKPDLALAISKANDRYIGHTCLTLMMAYNNARLIAKPESTWLIV